MKEDCQGLTFNGADLFWFYFKGRPLVKEIITPYLSLFLDSLCQSRLGLYFQAWILFIMLSVASSYLDILYFSLDVMSSS